jgi:single-strand DNA-binding protein
VEDEVQWHNLIAWGTLAKMVEDYVKKGMKLSIEGKLSYRSYVNKDGVEVRTSEILVKDVLLVERKIEREEEVESDESESEIPF